MPKKISTATPQLNRLRAAAGLIPIIEDGLLQKTISVERASVMATFCAWAHDQSVNDSEAEALAKDISEGLERIETAIGTCNCGP
jgi:hypothetical protein